MKEKDIYVGDFETTVFSGQTYTEVWASALVKLGTEDVIILGSIDETFDYLVSLKRNVIVYYHNLKFDGSFWLDYLLIKKGFKQASYKYGENQKSIKWMKSMKNMPSGSVQYSISDLGMWYKVIIKVNGYIIELRDSLKLLPFSVAELGNSFKTKHRKLEMIYEGFRYAGCEITDEEKEYISNDVLVVKEALEIMFEQGHTGLTIGACCLGEFKRIVGRKEYRKLFPKLNTIHVPSDYFTEEAIAKKRSRLPLEKKKEFFMNADDYIRAAYKGGWCYVVPEKAHQIKYNGLTADVNSLYPSVMHSESGCKYPYGEPHFWSGDYIPEECNSPSVYYYIRVKTRFVLKEGMLPFIQIKGNILYDPTECLTTSDVWNEADQCYDSYFYDPVIDDVREAYLILTFTMTDYILFREHYDAYKLTILDGCYFSAMSGIFDDYINKYRMIKVNSKGALRTLAKLFLNNLYGKMASSEMSSFKYGIIDDKKIKFMYIPEDDKEPGYIAIGAAITSYARNFTIRAAQQNYYGAYNNGFIYADTDSIHCDLKPEELHGVPVHPTAFCHWKLEAFWDYAYFARQKTYIEHITHEDGEPVEHHYSIKAAGMPQKCKKLFEMSLNGEEPDESMTDEEKKFLSVKRKITDFDNGLCVPGKLLPKRIPGGVVLVDTTFEMR